MQRTVGLGSDERPAPTTREKLRCQLPSERDISNIGLRARTPSARRGTWSRGRRVQNGGCARLSDVENAILNRERVPDTDNPRLYGLEHQDAIRSARSSFFGREQYEEHVDPSPHHITRMDPFLVAPCQALRKKPCGSNDKRRAAFEPRARSRSQACPQDCSVALFHAVFRAGELLPSTSFGDGTARPARYAGSAIDLA